MKLSQRMSRFGGSPTMAAKQAAADLAAQGVSVIDFSVGEPDFPTPAHVIQAAKDSLDRGETKYSAGAGLPLLRRTLAEHYGARSGNDLSPEQFLISCGGKSAILYVLLALLDPGDEVLIPAPCWVSFPDQVKLAEGEPILVCGRPEDGFRPRVEDLAAAVTDRTRLVILNSPCNPTGSMLPRKDWSRLVDLVREKNLLLLSDETYQDFVYSGEQAPSAFEFADPLRERGVVVGSFSKTYAMTGWRLGFAWAPPDLIKGMLKIQSQDTSHPVTFAQRAAVAALTGPEVPLQEMQTEYAARRELVLRELESIPGFSCVPPEGAFYVFPDVREAMQLKGIADDATFALKTLQEAHVSVVAGSAFGGPGCIRMSYAASRQELRDGLGRIRDWMGRS